MQPTPTQEIERKTNDESRYQIRVDSAYSCSRVMRKIRPTRLPSFECKAAHQIAADDKENNDRFMAKSGQKIQRPVKDRLMLDIIKVREQEMPHVIEQHQCCGDTP